MQKTKIFFRLGVLALLASTHCSYGQNMPEKMSSESQDVQSCKLKNNICRQAMMSGIDQLEMPVDCVVKQDPMMRETSEIECDSCMQKRSQRAPMPEPMMQEADMQQILQSLVVMIDLDFYRKMFIIDVDFYKDSNCDIAALLMRYMENPEHAEKMFHCIAQRYVDEYGDACVVSLLKGLNVESPEDVCAFLMPYMKKAFVSQTFNALHRCIMFKCMKLKEMMAQ